MRRTERERERGGGGGAVDNCRRREVVIELGIVFMCVSFNNIMSFCCENKGWDGGVANGRRGGLKGAFARVMANKSVMKLVLYISGSLFSRYPPSGNPSSVVALRSHDMTQIVDHNLMADNGTAISMAGLGLGL